MPPTIPAKLLRDILYVWTYVTIAYTPEIQSTDSETQVTLATITADLTGKVDLTNPVVSEALKNFFDSVKTLTPSSFTNVRTQFRGIKELNDAWAGEDPHPGIAELDAIFK